MKILQRASCAVFVLLLITISSLHAQNSNIGTEFWTGYMNHINPPTSTTTGTRMSLYIASDVASTVTITILDGSFTPQTVNVVPNVITVFDVPPAAFLASQGTYQKGMHIVSNNPVAVYAHIYRDAVSGATVMLPVNTLATDYVSINYKQISNNTPAYSTFMVIATEDSTTVKITPTAAMFGGEAANVPYTIKLQKGEIYQGLSLTDLTGTKISSISTNGSGCKRIAVYSGSSKIIIGASNHISNGSANSSGDNLIQQAYPTASWGKNFVTVPLKARNYDIFRVVLSDPTTKVTVNGTQVNVANNLYYEFPSNTVNTITGDKPIQVVQYAVSQNEQYNFNTNTGTYGANDLGDPEMIYLNPLEQNIDHVTLYATAKANITDSYVNIVIATSAAPSFLLDGVNQGAKFTAIAGSSYSYAQLSISTGNTHVISASKGFNAIAYGFGSVESYGYSAGTNVKNLNEYVQVADPTGTDVLATGCTNANVLPQIVLPYQTTRLIWDFGNGIIDTIAPPVVNKTLVATDGSVLYQYNYRTPIKFPIAGTYNVKVTATDPITTACGNDEDIFLNYTINSPPDARFTSRDTICLGDTIGFKDVTNTTVNSIKSWHWYFGVTAKDTSNLQNPVFTYPQSGSYTATLSVTGSSGCVTTYSKLIYVRKLPVAAFNVSQPVCESPLKVTFTDQSVPTEGTISARLWDFGDNTTDTVKNPVHAYASAQAQAYKVTLTVITNKGCSNTLSKNVNVNYTPRVSFNPPDVCEYDQFTHFAAITSIPDSTSDPLTYSWNFGDPTNTTNSNTATGKKVQHHFKGIGKYDVKLTVTSAFGCIKDTTQTIQVNGGNPKAAFKVLSGRNICSNHNVIFRNDAYVEGGFEEGKVTSFKFDYGDGKKDSLRIDSGQTFTHQYAIEYAATRRYVVSMVAYSGATCFSTPVYDTIYIEPVPKTIFNAPTNVCENGNPLQLADYAKQQYANTLTGKPVFYIDNIRSATGVFNPAVTGKGKHSLICYYYFNASSCSDTTYDTVTVEPVAAVKAGKDVNILSGQQTQLKPTIIGGGTTNSFLWSPAAGLSNPASQYPVASPTVTTVYKLTVTSTTDNLACPVSDSVKVTVLQPPIVPNTFTPNGDNHNDTWLIKDLDTYPGCTVTVYTRNGERVFYSVGYGIPWDGRYNGVNLPIGTYYYIIDPKNGRSVISGYVTIIR